VVTGSSQEAAFEQIYGGDARRWAFHYTKDPLTRYLRDRRLESALAELERRGCLSPERQSVLVVCGGVGGEGTYFRNRGFKRVTVSDFSGDALLRCQDFDPRLETRQLNAEALEVDDEGYDIVVVQDGLHHLPRPVLGFTEMLRVAREAVIVIEPHTGLAGRLLGTTWEWHGSAVNFVFRWNRSLLEQSTRSLLLSERAIIISRRMWDHNGVVGKLVAHLPRWTRLRAARLVYAILRPASCAGNMMIGVILKPAALACQN
jgi:SAM-dependent methyltransferase